MCLQQKEIGWAVVLFVYLGIIKMKVIKIRDGYLNLSFWSASLFAYLLIAFFQSIDLSLNFCFIYRVYSYKKLVV